jgi:hypothetical protein
MDVRIAAHAVVDPPARRTRGDDGGPRCDDDQRSNEVCNSLAWLRE